MSTINTATTDVWSDAILAAQDAEHQHPMILRTMAARYATGTVLAHLREFASSASHDDLVAEIDALHREVTR